jgi:hypothetical protein
MLFNKFVDEDPDRFHGVAKPPPLAEIPPRARVVGEYNFKKLSDTVRVPRFALIRARSNPFGLHLDLCASDVPSSPFLLTLTLFVSRSDVGAVYLCSLSPSFLSF